MHTNFPRRRVFTPPVVLATVVVVVVVVVAAGLFLVPVVTSTLDAALAVPPQGGNPEWVQVVLLIALFLVAGIWLLERTARFALLPQDTPGADPKASDRFDRVRGWVLLLVIEVEAALAVAGWLGIFA